MFYRRLAWVAGAMLVAASPPALAANTVEIVEGQAPDGTRYYEDSLVIAAPIQKLWAAFTDGAEFRRWSAPVSAVDFRLGGAIEASYDPKGRVGDPDNIKNAFIAYVPGRLLVFRNVQAPAGLPGRAVYGQTVKVVEFAPAGEGATRVTVSGIGFGSGPDFAALYRFFRGGDAEMLKSLSVAYATKK